MTDLFRNNAALWLAGIIFLIGASLVGVRRLGLFDGPPSDPTTGVLANKLPSIVHSRHNVVRLPLRVMEQFGITVVSAKKIQPPKQSETAETSGHQLLLAVPAGAVVQHQGASIIFLASRDDTSGFIVQRVTIVGRDNVVVHVQTLSRSLPGEDSHALTGRQYVIATGADRLAAALADQ